jgi:hypothetical protein
MRPDAAPRVRADVFGQTSRRFLSDEGALRNPERSNPHPSCNRRASYLLGSRIDLVVNLRTTSRPPAPASCTYYGDKYRARWLRGVGARNPRLGQASKPPCDREDLLDPRGFD